MQPCQCGCGEIAKKRFVWGHNGRTLEGKRNLAKGAMAESRESPRSKNRAKWRVTLALKRLERAVQYELNGYNSNGKDYAQFRAIGEWLVNRGNELLEVRTISNKPVILTTACKNLEALQ